jgi:hypothetical protein
MSAAWHCELALSDQQPMKLPKCLTNSTYQVKSLKKFTNEKGVEDNFETQFVNSPNCFHIILSYFNYIHFSQHQTVRCFTEEYS